MTSYFEDFEMPVELLGGFGPRFCHADVVYPVNNIVQTLKFLDWVGTPIMILPTVGFPAAPIFARQ